MAFAPDLVAQNSSTTQLTCFHPFAHKFAEFNLTNSTETTKVLKEFESKVELESSEARGEIFVYGGKQTHINEITDSIADLRSILKLPEHYTGNEKIWVSNGGYRTSLSAELYVRPRKCSEGARARPDFEVDQVEFAEAPPNLTIVKNSNEILDIMKSKTEIVCPPAATAVGACKGAVEVFIIINEKGSVVFSSAVSGHPLLRSSAAIGVKSWKFTPYVENIITFNVKGFVSIELKQRNAVLDY